MPSEKVSGSNGVLTLPATPLLLPPFGLLLMALMPLAAAAAAWFAAGDAKGLLQLL
jgi:hypothetical protein